LWSLSKFKPNQELLEKNKRVIKLKWKEHAQKMKERALQKVAGRKREKFLQKKADRIKGKADRFNRV